MPADEDIDERLKELPLPHFRPDLARAAMRKEFARVLCEGGEGAGIAAAWDDLTSKLVNAAMHVVLTPHRTAADAPAA